MCVYIYKHTRTHVYICVYVCVCIYIYFCGVVLPTLKDNQKEVTWDKMYFLSKRDNVLGKAEYVFAFVEQG